MDTKHKCKQYFCTNCLQGFSLEASQDKHRVYCEDNGTLRVKMPGKGSKIEFCDRQNQFKVPFIMYADFELILEPIQGAERPATTKQGFTSGGPNPVSMRPDWDLKGYQALAIWLVCLQQIRLQRS